MKKLLLIGIIILAFFLRFYKLNVYPAFNADEAAIGYNAYSLLQTGLDEHGNPWPIHFQSFNDYKPGLYFYLVLPFVKALGLNEWAVRIPNAALGVATVYLMYLLGNELIKGRKIGRWNLEFGFLPAFMLAISPWHLHFSRGGWEVNTATFFMVAGVLFFLKAANHELSNKSSINLLISSVSFVLSLYTYHAARIVTPLLIFGLLGIYHEYIRKNIKTSLICVFFAFVSLLPLAKDMLKPEISSRAAGVGLFADAGPLNRINEQRGEHAVWDRSKSKILHNKAVNYTLAFFENWTAHYHGLFLFLSGDNIERDKVPETGQMYLIDALFILIGLAFMVKNLDREIKLIIYWLLVAPFAAALTFQSPHALRSENMVIPLTIISAIGFYTVIQLLNNVIMKPVKIFGYLIACSLLLLSFFRYEHMYWVHLSKEYPYSSQYGVKELVSYVNENGAKFNKIIVTDRYDQPYILFLFFSKYPPRDFQNDHYLTGRDKYGFSTVSHFGKYYFTSIDWDSVKLEYPNSLIAGTAKEIPAEANIVKKIYGSNGFEYFDIVVN